MSVRSDAMHTHPLHPFAHVGGNVLQTPLPRRALITDTGPQVGDCNAYLLAFRASA